MIRLRRARFNHSKSALPAGAAESLNSSVRALLIGAGVLLVLAGLAGPLLSRYVGRLPGDIVVRRPGFTLVFPIVTCLILSLLLTLLLSFFRR